MSKHTPGPWWVALGSAFGGGCYSGISSGNHDYLAEVVVKMEDDNERSEQLQANARLIAAAPDLLEALQKCAAQLEMITGLVHDERAALIDARAAIAKATGEQA